MKFCWEEIIENNPLDVESHNQRESEAFELVMGLNIEGIIFDNLRSGKISRLIIAIVPNLIHWVLLIE